jgi:hypothetical protein
VSGLRADTYLLFLLIEVVNDDTNEEIQSEEGAKDDKEHEVQVHVDVGLPDGLLVHLYASNLVLNLKIQQKSAHLENQSRRS